MIITVFGDSTIPKKIKGLPRVLTIAYQAPADIVRPPAHALAVLAAILRQETGRLRPNKKEPADMAIWDLRELHGARGERPGQIATEGYPLEETEWVTYEPTSPYYDEPLTRLLADIKLEKRPVPRVIVLKQPMQWYNECVLTWVAEDPDYQIAYREKRIADSLYWLGRSAAVILFADATAIDGVPYADLPTVIRRMSDLTLYGRSGKLLVTEHRPKLMIGEREAEADMDITDQEVLDVLGFLAEPVLA